MKTKFKDLPKEERKDLINKFLFLTSYLDLCVEICDDLEQNPLVWKYKLKQKGKDFQEQCLGFLNEVLRIDAKLGTPVFDVNGKNVGTTDDVQEQAWVLIKKLKQINIEAFEEYNNFINE